MTMRRFYFHGPEEPEGAEFDCPNCGEDAIMTDDGPVCSNPDCETNA